jgi:AcrR family transcriptional regulator
MLREHGPVSRPRTGRNRSGQARQAILDAALTLALQQGGAPTVDDLAASAGVGKQTIYRWWPSKWAVVLDALLDVADREVHIGGSNPLQQDLERFLASTFTAIARPGGTGPLLRALMAQAQLDAEFAVLWRERFIAPRRRALVALLDSARANGTAPAQLDAELSADMLLGAMWYRLLVGHAPLDTTLAQQLARSAVT